MTQFHFTPERYLELMQSEVPLYAELQDETARATADVVGRRFLELGTGTGETARRVLALHPEAALVGIDASREMLAAAKLPSSDLRVDQLADLVLWLGDAGFMAQPTWIRGDLAVIKAKLRHAPRQYSFLCYGS